MTAITGAHFLSPHPSKKMSLTAPLGESNSCDQVAGADVLGPHANGVGVRSPEGGAL
jgi:hypothetical protein